MRRAALLLALTLPATALGQERQYRSLQLTDGRQIKAEVLETTPTGLLMATPQGKTLISFELLMDMVPIEGTEYRDQAPQRIWVYGGEQQESLVAIYGEVKSLEIVTGDEPRGLPPGVVVALEQCERDFACMQEALSGQDWMWLVAANPPTDETDAEVVVRGRTSKGPPINRADSATAKAADLWHSAHEVIGLVDEGEVPKSVLIALGEQGTSPVPTPDPDPDRGLGWTKARVHSVSFTPIPGYAALRQKDGGGFAAGAAVGLGGAGLLWGGLAAGGVFDDSGTAPQGAALGVLGTYVVFVAANQWVGMRAYERNKASSVSFDLGLSEEGTTVGIRGRLR